MRMRGTARDRHGRGQHDRRREHEPVDRRAFRLHAVDVVAEDAEEERDLAGDDAPGAVRVPGAHGDAVVAQALEEVEARFLAHRFDERREPLDVGRFHAEALLPLWPCEFMPRLGQVSRFHGVGVVRVHEQVQPIRRPLAVGRQRLGEEHVGEIR